MMKTISFLLILLIFTGCGGLAIKEKIIDSYYLVAVDIDEDCSLSYQEPTDEDNHGIVIGATVFAVGYNDKYMLVKQHPRTFPSPPDKKITNYYILPLKKGMDWRSKNGLIGPLTITQFDEKRKELYISDGVKFTKEIEDLK